MLVAPNQTWEWLSVTPMIWPAIAWQLGALAVGRAVSVHAMVQIDAAAKQPIAQNNAGLLWFFISLLINALILLAGNMLLALALKLVAAAVGAVISFHQAIVLAVFALLPAIFGDTLSRVAVGVIQPLSVDLAGVWAAHIKPFSLGLATILPQRFAPLSLPWYFASFVDAFALWSLACLWLGLKRFAGFNFLRTSWVTLGVMLILALVLAALWQAGQVALLQVTH